MKIVESVYRRNAKGSRTTIYPSYIPALGLSYWIASWMSSVVSKGHCSTYRVDGRLIARSATYQGV